MKAFRLFLSAIAAAACLNSCQSVPIIFDMIDFKPMSLEDAESQANTVVLRNSAKMEFSNNPQPFPTFFQQWERDIFKTWEQGKDYKVETIPAGTKVKILAVVHQESMGFYPFLLAEHTRHLVELPDGRRGTAFIPQAVEGLKVGFHNGPNKDTTMTVSRVRTESIRDGRGIRFWFKMEEDGKEYNMTEADLRVRGQLPVYHDGMGIYLEQSQLDSLKSKTLPEIEGMIAPTFNISRESGKLIAKFPFVQFKDGNMIHSGLEVPLRKKGGEFIAEGYEFAETNDVSELAGLMGFLHRLNSVAEKTSIKKHILDYGYYEHPRFYAWSSFEFNPWARKIFGVFIGIILFFLVFVFGFPWLARLIFFIKPLTNKQVKTLSSALYLVVYIATVYYFMIYSDFILLILTVVTVWIAFDALYSDIKFLRCESCHSVGTVVHDKTTHDHTVIDPFTTTIHTKKGRRWTFLSFLVTKSWHEHYICLNCGSRFRLNHKRSYVKTPKVPVRTKKRW